ncbi:MAG: hypothetical protein NTY45_15740 [Elusimicrobia bacterium]|nr:hypothetical protein [Elusimicrobiota bacterium]
MVVFLTTLLHVLAFFSVIAGWLRFRYKSLWAPAAFHSCFNLLGWAMCRKLCAPR